MKLYHNKSTIVHEDSDIFKLTIAVHKAVEDFTINKPTKPTRLFFNDKDFNLQGEVNVLGYKVRFTNFVPSGQLDSHRTGLTSEELEMCLRWREAYFEFHRYSGESSNAYSYTEEDLHQQEREQTEARNIMLEIEKELGEPQGRFTI